MKHFNMHIGFYFILNILPSGYGEKNIHLPAPTIMRISTPETGAVSGVGMDVGQMAGGISPRHACTERRAHQDSP